jgi:hypothetical protein
MEGLSFSNICNGHGGSDGGTNYIAHHDPFAYFNNIVGNSNRCAKVVATTGSYQSSVDGSGNCGTVNTNAENNMLSDLNSTNAPAFMWLTPNNYDNSHDCTLASGANAFINYLAPRVLNTNTFIMDPTATLIITFDEPSAGSYGTTPVYFAVAGPAQSQVTHLEPTFTPIAVFSPRSKATSV